MTSITRQNTLFVSEDWVRIYEAIENVDFRAYDFDNLIQAIMNHLRTTFPEEFNDWIASSEFVTKVEVMAWLSQNIAFRIDLNTRENFLATAERRDSLIRLAENVAFKVNRVKSASGNVKIDRVRTNQQLTDSNNIQLQDRDIIWNDPRNEDWFEQFVQVMNAALTTRTQFGRPLVRYTDESIQTDQYVFNSVAPSSGTYPFNSAVNGVLLPFDVINAKVNKDTGIIEEFPPAPDNAYNVLYTSDSRGLSSDNTGFFFHVKQGSLIFEDFDFSDPRIIRVTNIDVANVNNSDFFVQEIDTNGDVVQDWTQVDDVFGEGVSFNTETSDIFSIYELDTLVNDNVRVRFGDGKFGAIPQGAFRMWYRTANPQPLIIKPEAITNQQITIPYVSDNTIYYLTVTFSLKEELVNAASTESNFDIRTRANRVFYAQNRMITGEDYNNFFLKDNAIRKIKTVNRTFAGHSRYTKLTDPTGLYENLKVIAEDGRFYEDDTQTVKFVSGDPAIDPVDDIINNEIKPLIQKTDKRVLYINEYPQITFDNTNPDPTPPFGILNGNDPDQPYFWEQSTIVNDASRGNITNGTANNHLPVGTGNTTTNLKYVDVDAVITTFSGIIAYIDRIVETGQAESGVILREFVPDGDEIISVLPPIRTIFTGLELNSIEQQLNAKLDFGLSWNYITLTWDTILFENIDKTSGFSLDNQGDDTGTASDASWMIKLEFLVDGIDGDKWKITDRGDGYFFESAREVDFYFANNEPILNPNTGQLEHDTITIMNCNETRDSDRRLCISDSPQFISADDLFVDDVLRYPDGYVNSDGLSVVPADDDGSGFPDEPFLFTDLVIDDGVTDLVLWRTVEEQGFTVQQPINEFTSPRGTYGTQTKGYPKEGDEIATVIIDYDVVPVPYEYCKEIEYIGGDIHYDQTTGMWLVANSSNQTNFTAGEWEIAVSQSNYYLKNGRDDITFKWVHFSPDAFRIDPSVSNVMDAYILTGTYDDAYRTWLFNDGSASEEPTAPTSESLRIQFSDFDNFKSISDSIIYHSSRFLPLFGQQAPAELQATFKIIQSPSSTISENDIKLRCLQAINEYFSVENWDFGETFYFTELATFVHGQLTPEIQSVVIVPNATDQTFGRLFQVRSEPDQLFVSAASPENVEIVASLSDEELRIGSFC